MIYFRSEETINFESVKIVTKLFRPRNVFLFYLYIIQWQIIRFYDYTMIPTIRIYITNIFPKERLEI